MSIKVDCPNCGKAFSAPDECAGLDDFCPSCRTAITLPKVHQQRPPPIKAASQPIPPPKPVDPLDRIADQIEAVNFRLGCIIALLITTAIAAVLFGLPKQHLWLGPENEIKLVLPPEAF